MDAECGAAFNPARETRRPQATAYEKANYLSEEEEAALLETIRRDPSPLGKRDYALILTLLRMGWRAGEARGLKRGEIRGGCQNLSGRRLPGYALVLPD